MVMSPLPRLYDETTMPSYLVARRQSARSDLMVLTVLSFDEQPAGVARGLRKALPQSDTQDLRAASVCLAHDATLLMRNEEDFKNVSSPGGKLAGLQ